MERTRLEKFAELIVKCGINLQKGQEVVITAELDQPEFVTMVAEKCYEAGAKRVIVDWDYQPLTKVHVDGQDLETLSEFTGWEKARWEHYLEVIPCRIYLLSEDPDGLSGVDQEKLTNATQTKGKAIKPLRNQIENRYQWCIAAVPGVKWAKKLFPELSDEEAIEKLWEAILSTSRVDDDPILAWKNHNDDLLERCNYLNSLGITELEYHSSNGTDFRVGMIEEAEFKGGGEMSLQNIYFNPNIPSEEVFISPKKGVAEGIVYSTKPLSYNGVLIDEFSIRFENGKAVEAHAKKNEDLLNKIINMDETSCYLGECALVPYDSPIQNSGILFYNTLFDENAACHLALGMGFADSLKNYDQYTLDEAHELGINDSIIHEDFMIGSPDLDIIAHTKDGRDVQIFKDGNWAF